MLLLRWLNAVTSRLRGARQQSTARSRHGVTRGTSLCATMSSRIVTASSEELEDRALLAAVTVFDNSSFVDTSNSTGAESDNVQASLAALGNTVSTFTGTTAAAITAALDGKDAVLIPEQEFGSIIGALDGSARDAFADFVSSGGGLIINGSFSGATESFLNGVFGFSLSHGTDDGGPFSKTANAVGTAFAGAPASIPWNNGTYATTLASLPGAAKSIYQDGSDTAVAIIPFGVGEIVILAWDWYDAAPAGFQNGGWLSVLDDAVNQVTTASSPSVNLSVSAATGAEVGTTAITVTATASSAVSGNQTIDLGVIGTGITAGDYTLSNTTITISDGQTVGTVTFTVKDDLLFEGNETATLTISNPSSGISLGTTTSQNITITDDDTATTSTYGLPVAGDYRVVRNGSSIEIYNSTPILVASRPLGTAALDINGTSGNDTLIVDFTGGNFTVPITFNGGTPSSPPGDSLTLTGGTFATGTFAFTNNSSGTIDLTGNSQISYTGLEPIVTTGATINDLVFTFNGGAETITLTDAAGAAMKIDSTVGESVTFNNPSSSLTINAGTGDDLINITSVDTDGPFDAVLTINGDANNDTVTLTPALTLASLTVTAETINLNGGNVTTSGNQIYNGGVVLGTNTNTSGANVAFNGTLNSVATVGPVFQSATLGTPHGLIGTVLASTQFLGVRFQATTSTILTDIGIHAGASSGTFFGAIIALTGPNDFPDSTTLSTPDVLRAVLLPATVPTSELTGSFSSPVTITSGNWYGLIFGSGLFGASASGVAASNNTNIGSPSYYFASGGVGGSYVNGGVSNVRMFVASHVSTSLTVNSVGTTTFTGSVGNTAPLTNLSVTTTDVIAGAIATTIGVTINNTGTASTISGAITGAGATLTKQGTGELALSGSNTYSGATTVSVGTLLVNGSTAVGSDVTVQTTTTLGGTGTVNGTVVVQNGGTVAPGVSPGILTAGSVTFSSGANFDVEIDGITVGIDYDQLDVTGDVDLADATLILSGSHTPVASDTFTIITATGSVLNTFAGHPNGSTILFNSQPLEINYGSQNVVLSYDATPILDGTAGADDFVVFEDGLGNIVVSLGGTTILTTPFASLTNLTINGDDGNDTLTVDYSALGGFFNLPITFNGGNQVGLPGDTLVLLDGPGTATTITHTFVNENDGSVDIDGTVITYTGLEPVADNLDAVNRIFTFNAGAETITLTDAAGANMTIDSDVGGEIVTFANPTGSLTINAGTGADTVTITSVDAAYRAALTVNGDADADIINLNGNLLLGSTTSTGDLSFTAESIHLNSASIATDGDTTNNDAGSVMLDGAVTLGSDVMIDTGSTSANDGNITITGTVDATAIGAQGLTLTPLTADVSLVGVGTTTRLKFLSVTTQGTAFLGGDIRTDSSAGGTGVVTFPAYNFIRGNAVLTASVTIDTESGDAPAGVVNFHGMFFSANAPGRDLVIDASSNPSGNRIVLDGFNNAGGAYVNDLTLNAGGGNILNYDDIRLDANGADAADFTVLNTASFIVFIQATFLQTIDTEQGNNGPAGAVDFGATSIGSGFASDLSINTGTTAAGQSAGNIALNQVAGLVNLTISATGPAAIGDGTVSFNAAVTLLSGGDLTVNAGTIDLPNAASDLMTSGDGSVTLTATRNIDLRSGSSIVTADGNLTLSANQQPTSTTGNVGISVDHATISSTGGDVTLLGHGGSLGLNAFGVAITNGGSVSGGGSGTLTTVTGLMGSDSVGGHVGLRVTGTNSKITTTGGDVSVTGTSVQSGSGVLLDFGGQIAAGGNGFVTVLGTGGNAGSAHNPGVVVDGLGSAILSGGGNIQVTGIGVGSGGFDSAYGVWVTNAGQITAASNGNVTVTGTGGLGNITTGTTGIYVTGVNSKISSSSGSIWLTGTAGPSSSPAIAIDASASIQSTGAITLIGDSMSIASAAAIDAGANTVTLRQKTNSTAINLGGADGTGVLGLTDAELDRITAGTLRIGSNSAGPLILSQSVTLTDSPTIPTLHLITGSTVGMVYPAGITVSQLAIEAGGNVILDSFTHTVDEVAITTTTGRIGFYSSGAFTVTTVDGVVGVATASGNVSLATDNGNLTIANTTATNDVSATGQIFLGAFGDDRLLTVAAGADVESTGSTHTYQADKIVLDGTITAPGQSVVLRAYQTAESIHLGAITDFTADILELSNAELNRITAEVLQISDPNYTGAVTVTAAIDVTNSLTLYFAPNALVSQDVGATISATNFAVFVPVGFALNEANDVNVFAALATSGDIAFTDADGFRIDVMPELFGITAATGNVTLTATSGDVTIANTVLGQEIAAATGVTIALNGPDSLFTTEAASGISSSSGGIAIAADRMVLGGTISASSQSVMLSSGNAGHAINLGSTTDAAANTLELSDAELDRIAAGTIDIGNSTGGTITVSAAISRSTATNLNLTTGSSADIAINPGSLDAAGGIVTLTVGSGGQITSNASGTDVTGNLVVNGDLAPGASPGLFIVIGHVTFSAADTFSVEVNGSTTPGTDYDQLDVTGDVDLANATLNLSGSHTPVVSDTFTIITATGSVSNTFAGHPNGSTILFNSQPLEINYGSQNVVLSYDATPILDGTAGADDFVVFEDGLGNIVVSLGGTTILTTPFASLTNLTINGDDGNDTLTVDYSALGGFFNLPITFNGGNQVGLPGDTLVLLDGPGTATTITHTFVNENDGSVDIDGTVITYTGLEPVADNLDAVNRIFTFNAGAETITLTDAAGANMTIDSDVGGEIVTFANPTGSLTINAGTGADTVTITSVDAAYRAALTVNGDADADIINLNGNLLLGSTTSTGDLSFTAESIHLNSASIATDGDTTNNDAGSVMLDGAVTLGSDVMIDTGSTSANDGNITITGTVDATAIGAQGLTLTPLTADVSLVGVGTTTRLKFLSVTTQGTAFLGGDIRTDSSAGGTGVVTFPAYNFIRGNAVLTASVTIDTESGDAPAGVVNFHGMFFSANAPGRDLVIDASSNPSGNRIVLDGFNNAGGAYVNDLTLNAGGGNILNYDDIRLDANGADAADFTVLNTASFIVFIQATFLQTIDTEQGNDESAGVVDFGTSAINSGFASNLSIDTSTAALGQMAGNISLSQVDGLVNLTTTATGPTTAADGSVTFNDAMTLTSGGNLFVNAGAVDLPNATSDLTTSGGGDVTITSSANITFGSGASISAGTGDVTLSAAGAITTDAVGTDITATNASLNAGSTGIGTNANPLRLSVDMLVTDTNGVIDGDQYLLEADSLTIGASDLDAGTATITLKGGTFLTTNSGTVSTADDGDIFSDVVVASGATLGGTGTVTGTVDVENGGTVAPGMSPGILNTGSVTFVAGANFDVEVDGNVPGTGHDQLNVTGSVNLGGATLNASGIIASMTGQVIVLINNNLSDPVVGTFAGLAEGDTVFINTIGFKLSYVGGTGNDVTLTQLIQVTVVASPLSLNEDAPELFVFTFTRNGILDVMTVNYAITGSATFVTDYTQQTAGTFNGATGTVSFGFGQTTAIVYIDPKQDSIIEPNETVTLTLTPGSNYVPAIPNIATVTIIDDDINVSVAATPVSVLEDSGTSIGYTFTRTGVLTNPLTVAFYVNGTAAFGSDYTQTGATTFANSVGTVTFAANSATAVVSITPSVDSTVEPDETVLIGLTTGAGYNVVTPVNAAGTILNDDVVPLPSVTVAVSPSSVTEDGVTNLVYTFTRTLVSDILTVNFTIGGGANFVTDYTQSGAGTFNGATGTISFGFGQSTATITVDPQSDNIVEPDEAVVLTVVGGSGYNVGGSNVATGTIVNDDASVTIAVSPATVTEDGVANLVYTFTRTGATTNALAVNFNVGGSATFTNDYSQTGASLFTGTNGSLTFAPGSSTATVTVDPTTDSVVEADETVSLTITGGAGYVIDPVNSVTGTIANDDVVILPNVSVSVSPSSVTEDGATNLVYTFTRTLVSDILTVNFTIGGGATFVTDYTQSGAGTFNGATGTISFGFGQSTATITVNPKADSLVEANEDVVLTVVGGSGYNVGGSNVATGTITNDDFLPTVTLAVSPASVMENGSPNMLYTFTRTGATNNALTVNFTVGGTATLSSDYTQTGAGTFNGSTGSVSFGFGQSTATIVVNPKSDGTVESDETVILTLASNANYTVGTVTPVIGTITNDDIGVSVAISPVLVNEDSGSSLFYTFTRVGPTNNPLTVKFVANGTATFGTDYTQTGAASYGGGAGTVVIPAFSNFATVQITPTADSTVEADETVKLTVATGTGYAISSPSVAIGTIVNDDVVVPPTVSLTVSPASVLENGTPNLIYTFTRTTTTVDVLTVNFNVGGTATFVTDYTQSGSATFSGAGTGTIKFGFGQTTARVTINPKGDSTAEADETVCLKLIAGAGYVVGSPTTAVGTILNDDGPLSPVVSIAISPSVVLENGTDNLIYTFTRTSTNPDPLTINFSVGGTATFITDYTQSGASTFNGSGGTVTFGFGQTTARITIAPKRDSVVESTENIILSIIGGLDYTVGGSSSALGMILDI